MIKNIEEYGKNNGIDEDPTIIKHLKDVHGLNLN
jgi:hypothetical protein